MTPTLGLASALLFGLSLPQGVEIYASEDSVYAEHAAGTDAPVDITLAVFGDALAAQAIAEYRTILTEGAPDGRAVQAVEDTAVAGRPAVAVAHTKPAARAVLTASGEVAIEPAVERTRQVLVDVGAVHVVLTVWTKADAADIAALTDAILASVTAGDPGAEADAVDFTLDGLPAERAGEALGDGPQPAPVAVAVLRDP